MADIITSATNDQTALLEQFAAATFTKIITSQGDLDTKDRVMEEMMGWCKEQGTIVVLRSATILASDPTSRAVQNCKSLMLSKGIHPGQVYGAVPSFIKLLLASGQEEDSAKKHKGETSTTFSDQQRHLRDLVYEGVQHNGSRHHIQVRQTHTKIRMRQHC